MTPTAEDFARLRELTRMTGTLSNIQIHNLKMWASVILCARQAEMEFDAENHTFIVEASGIDLQAMMEHPEQPVQALYRHRMARFDECVRMAIGDEYDISVRVKGVELGRFPPKGPPTKAHPPVVVKKRK
jgi:hypothetical protein